MPFDRNDYRAYLEETAKEKDGDKVHQLRTVERAALKAQAITGDPNWDNYLTYLQAAIDNTEQQHKRLQEQLCGDVVELVDMMRIKLALAECNGRLIAWRAARDLPKDLIENGDKARDLLTKVANPS